MSIEIVISENVFDVAVSATLSDISLVENLISVEVSNETNEITINETSPVVSISNAVIDVTNSISEIDVIISGDQGPPGVDGSATFSDIAGENLSALRVVRRNPTTGLIEYADKDSLSEVQSVVGITTTAALSASSVTIRYIGEMQDNSWAWDTSGSLDLFLGDDGAIVSTAPSSGYFLKIGSITESDRININIGEAIGRA